jgi:hypothetical protein
MCEERKCMNINKDIIRLRWAEREENYKFKNNYYILYVSQAFFVIFW